MKVLLVNSDIAKNRGDRAITEGMIELIRNREEDVLITGRYLDLVARPRE